MQLVDRIKKNATPRRVASLIGGLCIVYLFVLRFESTGLRNIHWDEFNFLLYVHIGLEGELPRLQSFHGRLFSWLPSVWDNEVDQIIGGRRVLFVLQASSLAALWLTGRKILDSLSTLVGLAALLSVSYFLIHGIEFRYDTLITGLALWSCAVNILVRHRLGPVLAGITYAVAMLCSLKSALFVPPILVSLIVSADEEFSFKHRVRRVLYFGSGFAGALLLLGGHHLQTEQAQVQSAVAKAGVVIESYFYADARFPGISVFQKTLQHDRFAWLLFLLGMTLSSAGIYYCRGEARRRNLILFSLATPLLVLPFYRNSFPYFYAAVLPGVSLGAAAFLAPGHSGSYRQLREAGKIVGALSLILFFTLQARQMHVLNKSDRVSHVREVVAGVKEVFPEPTPYIDRAAMITSYPKIGPFMTALRMLHYRSRKEFQVKDFIENHGARFLLNNVTALDLSRESPWAEDPGHSYPKRDVLVLKNNFVHHWGPLWVLGKRLDFSAARQEQSGEFLVAGVYTLSAGHPVTFGDRTLRLGDTIQLEKGRHSFMSSAPGEVVFKWGDHLRLPRTIATSDRLFDGERMNTPP